MRPIRNSGAVLLDGVDEMPYAAVDAIHADPVDPMPVHEAFGLLGDLTAEGVDELLRLAGPACESPLLMLELRPLDGAIKRRNDHRSAFGVADAGFILMCLGLGVPPVVQSVAAACDQVLAGMRPWLTGRTLPNFGFGPQAYDADTLARLRALLVAHDPDGLLVAGDPLR